MTTLQEYLDQKYPTLQDKEKVKVIEIKKTNQERKDQGLSDFKLKGSSLNLSQYSSLEKVKIEGWRLKTPLTKLDVSNCSKLTYLDCRDNQITQLNLTSCNSLKVLIF